MWNTALFNGRVAVVANFVEQFVGGAESVVSSGLVLPLCRPLWRKVVVAARVANRRRTLDLSRDSYVVPGRAAWDQRRSRWLRCGDDSRELIDHGPTRIGRQNVQEVKNADGKIGRTCDRGHAFLVVGHRLFADP